MDEWNLQVPGKLTSWPSKGLRRISINSFDYEGTNAHCIVDDAYHYLKARRLQDNHNIANLDEDSFASSADSHIDMEQDILSMRNSLLDVDPSR
jgi:acyl transferase domain-containing protein